MKLTDGISMAFSDITRRKVRTILTVIAISVGSFLLVAMQSLGDSVQKSMHDNLTKHASLKEINVMPMKYDEKNSFAAMMNGGGSQSEEDKENSKLKIDKVALEKISKIDNIEKITAALSGSITGVSIDGFNVKDKKANVTGFLYDFDHKLGKSLSYGKELEDKNDVIIGEKYLKRIGITDYEKVIGKEINLKVEFPKVDDVEIKAPLNLKAKVVGTFKEEPNSSVIMTSDEMVAKILGYYTDKTNVLEEQGYPGVSVKVNDIDNVKEVNRKIQKDVGYSTFAMMDILKFIDIIAGIIKKLLSIAGLIVLVVASLGLVNTMTMTIQEKKRTIGVMRAVGASRRNVRIVFMFQSIMLGFLGGALGCATGSIAVLGLNAYLKAKAMEFTMGITLNNLLVGLGVSIVIAFIAGLIPAARAAKLKVVEVLSYE